MKIGKDFRNSNTMNNTSKIFKWVLTIGMLSFFVMGAICQENEVIKKRKTRLSSQIKQFEDNYQIDFKLSAKKTGQKGRDYFEGCKIQVLQSNDSTEVFLGGTITDRNGTAMISLPKSNPYILDEEGFVNFEAMFNGNDSLKANSSDLKIKAAYLNMEFYEEDSVKMIRFIAAENVSGEEEIPFEEVDVVLYSKGLFSLLKLGTAWMEGGEATFAFPTDLPGDTLGNLFLTARIEESEDHGVIETKGHIDWAKHKEIAHELDRGLGDTDAPLWMVYTLIILLSAVWLHYFYIIYSYYMINKLGK